LGIKRNNVVIGSYFTYGWMPTMLELRGDLAEVTAIANKAKKRGKIEQKELMQVAKAINRSV
jgi:hypothetical protein